MSQQHLYACWDEWPPIPNLMGISLVRGEGHVKDSVLQLLGPLVFGECMTSKGDELAGGRGVGDGILPVARGGPKA